MELNAKQAMIVVNPKAGAGKAATAARGLADALAGIGYATVAITETRAAGHAQSLATQAAQDGLDSLWVIGGDGTINEAGKGLLGTETTLGIVPMGSGNGLARHLKIPMSPKNLFKSVPLLKRVSIDSGMINAHNFFVSCGIGFDAVVANEFAKSQKRGFTTYATLAFHQYQKVQPFSYSLVTDSERIEGDALVVALGNAPQYGNNAFICPRASMQDSLLHGTIIQPFPPLLAPLLAGSMFANKLDVMPYVRTFITKELQLRMNSAQYFHADGEALGKSDSLKISVGSEKLFVFSMSEKL